MATLVQQWDEIVALEPGDWENLFIELRLDGDARMEDAALHLCTLNPWHGESWRSGWLRFRVARTFGYGADDAQARAMLAKCDANGIAGTLTVLRSVDRFQPVSTQGTV